jgi:ribonuclease P protein component
MLGVPKVGRVSLSKRVLAPEGENRTGALRYKKRSHLCKADEISSVFDFKCSVSSTHFIVLGRPNGLVFPRLAIMVAKKTARLAVTRNYMRRIVREYFRRHLAKIAVLDIVVRVKKPFCGQDFSAISQEISDIVGKLHKCQKS